MSGPRKHVAVLVFPFASHTAPMLTVVRRISDSAPDALFSFFGTKTSNGQVFAKDNPEGLKNIRPCYVDDGLPEGFVPSGHPLEPVELFLKVVPGNFYESIKETEQAVGLKISCLITDAFLWFGADMAQEMGVPWIPVWFSGARPLLAHVCTDLIRETIGSEGIQDNVRLDFIPGLESVRATDLPWEVIRLDPNLQFSTMIDKMARSLPQATAVAINSFDELDPFLTAQLEKRLKKVINVGPISLLCPKMAASVDCQGCIAWLDEQEPSSVVYISFGSVITPLPHELTALSEALEELGVPFLWSFRGNPEEQLPREFVGRTRESSKSKIVPWAPQLDILRHKSVGAFLTHCGWNSLLEGFIGGVPTIMRPFYGDQQMNCRCVESVLRVGIGLKGGEITRPGTVAALTRVLLNEEGKEMRERIGALKQMTTSAVAASGSSIKNLESLVKIVTE